MVYPGDVDAQEREHVVEWISAWRSAGEILEAERRQRLRSMTPAERRRAIDTVLAVIRLGGVGDTRATGSGLVEMQRLLARGRR